MMYGINILKRSLIGQQRYKLSSVRPGIGIVVVEGKHQRGKVTIAAGHNK